MTWAARNVLTVHTLGSRGMDQKSWAIEVVTLLPLRRRKRISLEDCLRNWRSRAIDRPWSTVLLLLLLLLQYVTIVIVTVIRFARSARTAARPPIAVKTILCQYLGSSSFPSRIFLFREIFIACLSPKTSGIFKFSIRGLWKQNETKRIDSMLFG